MEKVKVGIISFNIHSKHLNYGAALHSYAFQTYLKKCRVDSTIIDYIPQSLENYYIKYPILNNMKIWEVKPYIGHFLRWSLGFFPNIRKYNKFQKFFTLFCERTVESYKSTDLLVRGILKKYNFSTYVCESDVIWKTRSTGGKFDEIFFLNFPDANENIKVAYAPSLGSKPFSKSEINIFKKLTTDFKAITTREKQGAEYLSTILSQKVDWALDPTLLLYQEDYEKLQIKPKEEKYLLVYNCMINDKKMLKEAAQLAQRHNLKLIEISIYSENKLFFNHQLKDDIGIEEFLGYFINANFVVCNAFHGCCFSVIFKKEFFLFLRDSTDYRMKNLTDALGISDRLIHYSNKKIPSIYKTINYKDVDNRLEKLRLKSFQYIKENICTI